MFNNNKVMLPTIPLEIIKGMAKLWVTMAAKQLNFVVTREWSLCPFVSFLCLALIKTILFH
jgi:hypothetical protein